MASKLSDSRQRAHSAFRPGLRRRILAAAAGLLAAFALPLLLPAAYAQEGIPATGASAGTMVAAAMETVGYHAQAAVLGQLNEALSRLGALIYLCVALSAVMTVAMLGTYRPALWMLVAPPLFAWASGVRLGDFENREFGAGAEWRFGAFYDQDRLKDRMLEEPDVGEPAEVSFLFNRYNKLISEASQYLIGILTNQDIGKQMIFLARQRTLEELLSAEIIDSQLLSLSTYFLVYCELEISDARAVALGSRDPTYASTGEYAGAKARYCTRFPKRDKPFHPGAWMTYVYANFPEDTEHWTISAEEHQETGKNAEQLVSCKELWKWYLLGTKKEADRMMETVQSLLDPYVARLNLPTFREVIGEIFDKITADDEVPEHRLGPPDPCPEASSFDSAGAENPGGGVGGQDPTPQEGPTGRLQANAATFEAVSRMIGSLIARKQINSHPIQEIVQRVAFDTNNVTPRTEAAERLTVDPDTKRRIFRRQRAEEFATARRYEAFMLLHLLPYLQGMLLYALAASYPFFAMLILLPSHAGAFFTWMALWAWVKSWDVGWAALMVADEIIWELLPHATFYNPQNPAPYSSAVSLLSGAYDGDAAYSISTYWVLLSTMVTGVPIVTAQAILGTKKAVANVLVGGFQDIAENLAGYAADYHAARQVGRYTQMEAQAMASRYIQQGETYAALSNSLQGQVERNLGSSIWEDTVTAQATGGQIVQAQFGIAEAAVGQALSTVAGAAAEGDLGVDDLMEAGQGMIDAAGRQLENFGTLPEKTPPTGEPGSRLEAQEQRAERGFSQARRDIEQSYAPKTQYYGEEARRMAGSWNGDLYREPGEAVVPGGEEVARRSAAEQREIILSALGFDIEQMTAGIDDPQLREQFNHAIEESLYRRGVAYRLGDRADAMTLLGFLYMPVGEMMKEITGGSGNSLGDALDGGGAQEAMMARIMQSEELLDANIHAAQLYYTQDSALRSTWWRDSYYGAGNLANRAEFFLDEMMQLNPSFYHIADTSTAYADMEFAYATNRAHWDAVRWGMEWTFEPILRIWAKVSD